MSADSTVTIEYTAIPEYARWTLVLVHPKDLRAYGEFRMGFNLVHPETFDEGWEHPTMSGWEGDEEVFGVQLGVGTDLPETMETAEFDSPTDVADPLSLAASMVRGQPGVFVDWTRLRIDLKALADHIRTVDDAESGIPSLPEIGFRPVIGMP